MLKFQPFLTLNKQTSQLTYHNITSPIDNTICIVQTTQPSLQKLMLNVQCQVQLQKKQGDYGIYISQQPFQNHYILYLDGKQTKQIEDKYLSFFEKIIITLTNKIVFGDRSDYSRLLACIKDRDVQLYMYLQTKNQTYKINSINDNRLQIGYSEPFTNILDSVKQKSVFQNSFLFEIKSFFEYSLIRQTRNISNLNIYYDWIISGIQLRKQYSEFKSAMIDKATCMFKKQQFNTLISHVESLSSSNLNYYQQHLIQTFKKQLILQNQSLKQQLLQQIYQRYKNINATTFQQFKMQISVKFQLIKYSVDQYLQDSIYYANSILYKVTTDFCQPLFTSLKTNLQQQIQTKECLTNQLDQQIIINESLKKQIGRLNWRIDQMSNIDQVLKIKDLNIRDLQAKNDKLRSTQILLEGENIKKDNLIKHLQEKIKEKVQLQKELVEQINKKNIELCNLSKINKQTQKDKEQLIVNLKKKTDESNQMRKIFHSAHEAKSVFEKKAQSQQRCLNEIQNRLDDIKQAQRVKANMIISLNISQHKQIQSKNFKLQCTVATQQKKINSINQQNRKLKIQISYFQKMFNHSKQKCISSQPLIIIEQNNESSTDRNRIQNQQRTPLRQNNSIREQGQEWINSSRKQYQKSINSLNKLQIEQQKYKYF